MKKMGSGDKLNKSDKIIIAISSLIATLSYFLLIPTTVILIMVNSHPFFKFLSFFIQSPFIVGSFILPQSLPILIGVVLMTCFAFAVWVLIFYLLAKISQLFIQTNINFLYKHIISIILLLSIILPLIGFQMFGKTDILDYSPKDTNVPPIALPNI